jgi:hypothetical protein
MSPDYVAGDWWTARMLPGQGAWSRLGRLLEFTPRWGLMKNITMKSSAEREETWSARRLPAIISRNESSSTAESRRLRPLVHGSKMTPHRCRSYP